MRRPVIWHIAISHYSEKVRWAVDFKGIDVEYRAPPPGLHMVEALWLTRGRAPTLPIMRVDGRTISDSSAIIVELERRFPEPALYPADTAQLRPALALEDAFDRQLGPAIRRFVWSQLRRDSDALTKITSAAAPSLRSALARTPLGYERLLQLGTGVRYGAASGRASERARAVVLSALDMLEAQLAGRQYLVGDRFTVADLTAASLFYPLVLPPEGPQVVDRLPATLQQFRAAQADRPGYRWIERIYAHHRRPAT